MSSTNSPDSPDSPDSPAGGGYPPAQRANSAKAPVDVMAILAAQQDQIDDLTAAVAAQQRVLDELLGAGGETEDGRP